MELSLLALWYVCALGASVFAAAAPRSRVAGLDAALMFAVGVWWAHDAFAPSVATVGVLAALAAAWHVIHPPRRSIALAMAGGLAGLWTGALEAQGVPALPAIVLAAALPLVSARLRTRHADFVPPSLREEALLFLVVLGLLAAAAPGIADGWHAAGNLSVQSGDAGHAPTSVPPTWTLAAASAALTTGGLFSLWSRR